MEAAYFGQPLVLLGWKMEKWFLCAKKADFQAWADRLGVDQVIARLIRNRDVTSVEDAEIYLKGTMKDCHSPWLLKDVKVAVKGLLSAVREGKRIRVIGDYDVDGICSSFILKNGIALLGGVTDVAIPHRIHDGYGLNENLIREAAADGIGLIVTCDNGISAGPQIQLARELGMDVIVTDHHEVPFVEEGDVRREILPDALAVVDPKRSDDEYPFSGICGGVVVYKFLQATLEYVEQEGLSGAKELRDRMEEFLEFAAFATICDIMELKDENRIIVKEGLCRMRRSRNAGIRALMAVNGIEPKGLSAYHLGFVLGPCLNATGRLDTARRALDLLDAETDVDAVSIAMELKELNDSRKNLTIQGVALAVKAVEEKHWEKDKVLVVYLPDVHESLAGIIAGRVREQFGRPSFVLTNAEGAIKGSGRSTENYNMYEALTAVKDLLTKFGGHKMAAGLSLAKENVEEFRRRLNENCTLTEEDFVTCLHIDVAMPMEYVTMDLIRQMEVLEPFGIGNPKPLFAQKEVTFVAGWRMGKDGRCGRFQVMTKSGRKMTLVYFGDLDQFLKWLDEKHGMGSSEKLHQGCGDRQVTIAYQVGINSFRGRDEVQFLMKAYQ